MSVLHVPNLRVALAVLLLEATMLVGATAGAVAPALAAMSDDWQVWLDAPIPSDSPPGSTVHIGFIAWNAAEHSTVNAFGFEVHLHPKTGPDRVTIGEVDQDWPGHSTTDVVVPKGGFGRLEFGVDEARGLSSSRTLTLDFHPMPVAGIGPPPGIPLRVIGTVRPSRPISVATGEPFAVDLTFEPRLDWPAGSLPLPDALTLRVRLPGHEGAQDVRAALVDPSTSRYRATVELDQPGPYILEPAMEPNAPPPDRFTETEVRVVAERSSGGSGPTAPGVGAPTNPGAGPVDGGPPVALLAFVALALAGGLAWLVRFLRAEW